MIRILFVHQVSTIGGGSYCLIAMLKGLDKTLFEPIVLLREYGPLAIEIKKMNIQVEYMQSLWTIPYNKTLLSFYSIRSYCRTALSQSDFLYHLKRLDIDIVYLNNMMLYPYLRTAKENGYRTIMHVREHWPKGDHILQMKRAQIFAKKYADRLIAINSYSSSMFTNCQDKTSIVYDWFDAEQRFEPISFSKIFGGNIKEKKIILFTGGIGRIKGSLEVVKTFSEIIKGDEYRLLVMGNGTDYKLSFSGMSGIIKRILMIVGWRPYGYRVCRAINEDKRIVVIPPTYNLVDIYKQAYFTISYFTIPHANLALAEAVSLGVLGVAARTDESIEYSDDGKGAVLFNMNDLKDFINKIKYVIENYLDAKKKAEMHAMNVKNKFAPKNNIEVFNKVCREVASLAQ